MQTNISLQMNKIKKYKKRRYHLDNGVKIVLLVVSFPDLGNRNASDAPIISIDFIDNDNSSLFVFTEHVVQQIGSTFYQGGWYHEYAVFPRCFLQNIQAGTERKVFL